MTFKEPESITVISTCITNTDSISRFLNKTANQVDSKEELITEVFRQLKETFTNLPEPTVAFVKNTVYRENNKWVDGDTAYIMSSNRDTFIDHKLNFLNNVYSIGTQNGNSPYYFTSFESAVSNAIYFCNKEIPKSIRKFEIKKPMELKNIIVVVIIIILLLFHPSLYSNHFFYFFDFYLSLYSICRLTSF